MSKKTSKGFIIAGIVAIFLAGAMLLWGDGIMTSIFGDTTGDYNKMIKKQSEMGG